MSNRTDPTCTQEPPLAKDIILSGRGSRVTLCTRCWFSRLLQEVLSCLSCPPPDVVCVETASQVLLTLQSTYLGNPNSDFNNVMSVLQCEGKIPDTSKKVCFVSNKLAMLDVFGIILYSVLTLMASVSMLIYIEECVYIYRKVSANKKSAIIWVNGAAPVIGAMSCLGMWIPRATMFTDMTSATYFAIVVFKFLILMIEECGGDEVFLKRSINKTFRISTGPCCCCCPCLPQVPITRRSLFMLKLGSFQFALLKVVFTILSIILWRNGNFDVADMKISGAAIWINPGVGVLTIIALWPVAIMFIHVRNTLRSLNIVPKYAMYQLVLVLSQLQTAIINILAMSGTIGCSPPYSSQSRGYLMSQQLLILEMFIITLVTRLLYRRKYDPIPYSDSEVERNIASATESSEHCAKI